MSELEIISRLEREIDRRGRLIEVAIIWRQGQEPEWGDEGSRRADSVRLRHAVDDYLRESLNRAESTVEGK